MVNTISLIEQKKELERSHRYHHIFSNQLLSFRDRFTTLWDEEIAEIRKARDIKHLEDEIEYNKFLLKADGIGECVSNDDEEAFTTTSVIKERIAQLEKEIKDLNEVKDNE